MRSQFIVLLLTKNHQLLTVSKRMAYCYPFLFTYQTYLEVIWIGINVKSTRVNRAIRASEVRLISADGEQIGIKPIEEAIRIAEEEGLDLVEVASKTEPPVCRVMDYGKYKYQLEQKAKKAKKHQTVIIVKEIKIRIKIGPHDFKTKENHVRKFLKKGTKVKVTIMFRGREVTHPDIGRNLLDKMAEEVKDLGAVESAPKLDGHNMVMLLAPSTSHKEESEPELEES